MTPCRSVPRVRCKELLSIQRDRDTKRKLISPILTIWRFRPRIGAFR